eukprot:1501302-Rhodomonas_salina.3
MRCSREDYDATSCHCCVKSDTYMAYAAIRPEPAPAATVMGSSHLPTHSLCDVWAYLTSTTAVSCNVQC